MYIVDIIVLLLFAPSLQIIIPLLILLCFGIQQLLKFN